ncbi:MAG: hypothetical protein ACOYO9_08135 [Candidatus Nanopelagicales bacterium]
MLAMEPRAVEAVWRAIEGHLPARPPDIHPLGCHRPRIPDRDCFEGILTRLVTGCSWDGAARGEALVIANHGRPMVKVVPIDAPDEPAQRRIGVLAGVIEVPDDFDSMGAGDIGDSFEGSR